MVVGQPAAVLAANTTGETDPKSASNFLRVSAIAPP